MKRIFEKVFATFLLSSNFIIPVFADSGMAANQLLELILNFLQRCSYLILVFGIGMFVYSAKNSDGPKKTDSLKLFGVALLLFGLKKIAEVGNLI